jgi:GNAT superfamily N-acetyltransferase
MPAYDIILTDTPDAAAEAVIENGLAEFNRAHSDYQDKRPLAVLARDPVSGQTIGGMLGRTSLGLLFIDLVYLPPTLRGQDIGSHMLEMIEQEAARRGCRSATVMTISFQAPGFYERHGWREFGRLPCDPPGTFRVLLSKALSGRDGA